MAVPKTAVNEYNDATTRENNIGSTWQVFSMQSKSTA